MSITDIEVWRPVPLAAFGEFYEVSNLGRVRSLDRLRSAGYGSVAKVKGRVMRLRIDNRGYVSVHLRAGLGVAKRAQVHRLVAGAFIPNPKGLREVNHIDFGKTNNRVENLEWNSRVMNYLHAAASGRMPFKRVITEGTIRTIKRLYDGGLSMEAIGRKYGINQGTISRIIHGKRRRHWIIPP